MGNMLDGKVAVITGAGQGVGKAITDLFAGEGASVILTDINLDAASQVASNLIKAGYKAEAKFLDISDLTGVKGVIEEINNIFGAIDIWVNNAGITSKNAISDITEKEWDKILDINLKGTFFYTQAVFEIMKAHHAGKLIHISSLAGLCGSITSSAAYAIAKAGILNLSKCFAKAGAPYGITSNCICPGHVLTKMAETLEYTKEMEKSIPLGRFASSEDIAGCALFYASSLSDYVTGTHLDVNGGEYIGL